MEIPDVMLKANLDMPFFMGHTLVQGGLLPTFERGAHACWYYCRIAHRHLEHVAGGATYVGELDKVDSLYNLAKGIAMAYRLDSPAEFTKFFMVCRLEALRCGMHWNDEILNPFEHGEVKRITQ